MPGYDLLPLNLTPHIRKTNTVIKDVPTKNSEGVILAVGVKLASFVLLSSWLSHSLN